MVSDAEKFIRFCESDFGKRVLGKEAKYVYKELKSRQNILDIGCGIGQFEQKIKDLNITGLDSSEEMLEESRRRSNKTFVLGNAENLDFSDSSFDAVFYAATLEFIDDCQKAIQEALRVTKPNGKLLVMMLNPESEYFHEHMRREGSYFRKVKHTNLKKIRDHISKFYRITKEEYFLGINGQKVFNTANKKFASLYVIVGKKLYKWGCCK